METFKPAPVKPEISFDTLNQIDLRVGAIEKVEDVAGSDKLVKLTVNFGDHKRTILAGLKQERVDPKEIEGKQALFVVNLPPKKNDGAGFGRDVVRHRLRRRRPSGAGRP